MLIILLEYQINFNFNLIEYYILVHNVAVEMNDLDKFQYSFN